MSDVFELMQTTRAMRRLKPDPVPREMLEKMVEAATWAPSGGNQQQYSWVIVTERDKMAELAELWKRCHDFYVAVIESPPQRSGVSARVAYDAAGAVLATGDRRYVRELREWEPAYAWRAPADYRYRLR